MVKYFEVTAALVKYFEDTAALGKYFEALPFSNFQKQMVSGSKLKCPSKVSWEVSFSLYYTVIYGNCLGNVVIGMEKCGKMCENVEKCAGDPFSIYYSQPSPLHLALDISRPPCNI